MAFFGIQTSKIKTLLMQRIISITCLFIFMMLRANSQEMNLFDKLLYVNKGDTLPYRLLKPVSPNSMESFPLVIFLHGAGERGSDNEVHIKHITELFTDERNRGKYPCYVVAPQCSKNDWWARFDKKGEETTVSKQPTKPMQMVIELIEKISKDYRIDQSRIYITGLSMGGYGTWDLLARFPEKFAAAVPICGGGATASAKAFKHVPIWAFHGALDAVVPPMESRKMIAALQQAGGVPGYTEYPDIEHNSWEEAYKEPHLIHWLFKQQVPAHTTKKAD
jgi:predicted peptidase